MVWQKGMKPMRGNAHEALADALADYYADPLGHVMFSYPWDKEPSIQMVPLQEPWASRYHCKWGPDRWACEFLDDLGLAIAKRRFNGRKAVEPIQCATSSGHGIGKSTLTAWLIKFIMDTRPYARGIVTAVTDSQLRTRTWAELGKWHALSLTNYWFDYNTGRGLMSLVHKKYKEQWRCDAQTSREENSEAFAGLHSANSTPFYIIDEASGVPDKIFEVSEGGLTDGEPMRFLFGNPTRNSGFFYEACEGRFKHRFRGRQIDSRDAILPNKGQIEHWIEDYGIDSDFVKVRVRGMFPSAGNAQFIPTAYVKGAQERVVAQDRHAPLLIGVDVARFGSNESVIWPRMGDDARSFPPDRYSGLDTVQLTGKVVEKIRYFNGMGLQVGGLFVDGGGIGGGVVDQLRALGYCPIEVQFGGSPTDATLYRFKSDEMWGRMRERLQYRLAIPAANERHGADIARQLTQREYGYTIAGNKIHLESKADMSARLGEDGSPDLADALALTFAEEVAPVSALSGVSVPNRRETDYDPLATKW